MAKKVSVKNPDSGGTEPFYNADGTVNPKAKDWGYNPKKATAVTKGLKGQGIGVLTSGLGNFMNDAMRNTGNLGSSLVSFFSGQAPPKAGAGYGDYLVGRAPAPKAAKKKASSKKTTSDDSAVGTPEPTSLQDLISAMMDQYGSSASSSTPAVDYNALRDNARQRAASSDAQLAAMYQQLQNQYQGDLPTVQGQFDSAIQSTGASADDAAKQIQQGYDSARAAQSAQLAALGIQDAAGNLAAMGGNAAGDQAAQVGNVLQNKAANLGQLNTGRADATQYQNGLASSAALEGAQQRGSIQQQLNDLLAQYDTQESQQNAQLANTASSNYADALAAATSAAKAENDDAWTRYTYPDSIALQQQKLAASNPAAQSAAGNASLQALMKALGITNPSTDDLVKLSQVIKNLG